MDRMVKMEFDEDGKLILKKVKYKINLVKKKRKDHLDWFFRLAEKEMKNTEKYYYG